MDDKINSNMEKSTTSHHAPYQIQQLESFFEVCPHPNESQKKELGTQLGLDTNQVKIWFQNKRNQEKVHNGGMDTTTIQLDNERLQSKNQAFSELLKNVVCSDCDVRKDNVEKLRRENAQLRVQYERISKYMHSGKWKPVAHFLSLPSESLEHLMSLPAQNFFGEQSESSSIDLCIDSIKSSNPITAGEPVEISEEDKFVVVQNAFLSGGDGQAGSNA